MGQDRKVFVGGVPQDLTEDDLYAIFSKYADVKKAWVQKNRAGDHIGSCPHPNHRGFGFVIFRDARAVTDFLGDNVSRFITLKNGARVEVKRAMSYNQMGTAGPLSTPTGKGNSKSATPVLGPALWPPAYVHEQMWLGGGRQDPPPPYPGVGPAPGLDGSSVAHGARGISAMHGTPLAVALRQPDPRGVPPMHHGRGPHKIHAAPHYPASAPAGLPPPNGSALATCTLWDELVQVYQEAHPARGEPRFFDAVNGSPACREDDPREVGRGKFDSGRMLAGVAPEAGNRMGSAYFKHQSAGVPSLTGQRLPPGPLSIPAPHAGQHQAAWPQNGLSGPLLGDNARWQGEATKFVPPSGGLSSTSTADSQDEYETLALPVGVAMAEEILGRKAMPEEGLGSRMPALYMSL
jgi:hypothetical protein